jgi:hypothetical protein
MLARVAAARARIARRTESRLARAAATESGAGDVATAPPALE